MELGGAVIEFTQENKEFSALFLQRIIDIIDWKSPLGSERERSWTHELLKQTQVLEKELGREVATLQFKAVEMLEKVLRNQEDHQTSEIVQLMKREMSKEELKREISLIIKNGAGFIDEDKLRRLNLELLLMKGDGQYQEHPIEEKALQIFRTNLNTKRNLLRGLRRAYIVTNTRETHHISKLQFMIQELREVASQMENYQYFLHSWTQREQEIYEGLQRELVQKLRAITS